LLGVHGCALHGQHQRSGQSSEDVHYDEVEKPHAGQPQEIAQRILWKAGNEKENEGHIQSFVSDEEIELVYVCLLDDLLHEPQPEHPRYRESSERAEGKADRGEDRSPGVAENEASDEPCYLTRHRGENNLEGLNNDEGDGGEGSEGEDEEAQFLVVEEKTIVGDDLFPRALLVRIEDEKDEEQCEQRQNGPQNA